MEADVNVLVVGSSTARSGAIGRHFPFPLIRRCLKPVLRRWLTLPSGDWASEAGEEPTESWERGGEVGMCECVCLCVGGVSPFPFSLLIWRT